MENKKNIKRDYDKEPIVISNNFTSLGIGIIFWFLFNVLIIYGIFFSDKIDWSQNRDWLFILKEEIRKSPRFNAILSLYFMANIGNFYLLYKILKNPKALKINNNIIEVGKSLNDLEKLRVSDIKIIRKSFFPLLITGKGNFIIYVVAGLYVSLNFLIFWLIRPFIWCYHKVVLRDDPYVTKYPYIIIFSKTTNRVINIHIVSKKEYSQLRSYFLDKLNIDLDKIDINFNLSNIQKGVENGR